MKIAPAKTPCKFDDTFKREAVENGPRSGKSAEAISREPGSVSSMLHAWKKRFDPGVVGLKSATLVKLGSPPDLQSPLKQAMQENRRLKKQQDIPKYVGYSFRTIGERYQRIEAMRADISLRALCEKLGVSPNTPVPTTDRPSPTGA